MNDKNRLAPRLLLVLLALALGLALASCGAPAQQPAGAATRLDSCALLTGVDAEALLNAPVGAPSSDQFGGDDPQDERAASQCLYHTVGENYKSVSVLIRRGGPGEDARAGLQQIRNSNPLGGALDPVAGLGEEALWIHGGDADQLAAAKGRFLVIASADLGKNVSTFEASKTIARHVLEQLP
jgi:hypothetical protein